MEYYADQAFLSNILLYVSDLLALFQKILDALLRQVHRQRLMVGAQL